MPPGRVRKLLRVDRRLVRVVGLLPSFLVENVARFRCAAGVRLSRRVRRPAGVKRPRADPANACPSAGRSARGRSSVTRAFVLRGASFLSALVVLAWAILIATTPSDPQMGVDYVFTTLYAVLALVVIWVLASSLAIRRRRRRLANRNAKPS